MSGINVSESRKRPNIVFIMADDHAAHAISSYGSRINSTPNIDRIADGGMRLDHCYCTNALCAPSRATILTGTYNHVNNVTTLATEFDNRMPTFPGILSSYSDYQTAMVGKWHLGHGENHDPKGFAYWDVLRDQGSYWDPEFLSRDGSRIMTGYVTDVITDLALDWLDDRDPERPFCLLMHHKAPHRWWQPHYKHATLFADEDVAVPETFFDDYDTRSDAAREAKIRIADHLTAFDLKGVAPNDVTGHEKALWNYQRYIKDYLRCVASLDESVGRVLDYLDAHDLASDTVVVYTSDQGFFLGDHGWYDKRFMYEESLQMPFLVRYPREIPSESTCGALAMNVDFAQTFLDYAGLSYLLTTVGQHMQGRSLRPLLRGESPTDWRQSVYYRYWEHGGHGVRAHYGVRTHHYKLIYYYSDGLSLPNTSGNSFEPEWELFDLSKDPQELRNRYHDPTYASVREELTAELDRAQKESGDAPWAPTDAISVAHNVV